MLIYYSLGIQLILSGTEMVAGHRIGRTLPTLHPELQMVQLPGTVVALVPLTLTHTASLVEATGEAPVDLVTEHGKTESIFQDLQTLVWNGSFSVFLTIPRNCRLV